MGLFLCELCNENLGFLCNEEHKCDPGKLTAHVQTLKKEKWEAEKKLNDIQNSVFMFLKENGRRDSEDIERLWKAAQCQWDEKGVDTAEKFIVHWVAAHRILCEAFDLFRPLKFGKPETILKKLKDLKKQCEVAQEVFNYRDSDLSLSPEDVIELAKKENL